MESEFVEMVRYKTFEEMKFFFEKNADKENMSSFCRGLMWTIEVGDMEKFTFLVEKEVDVDCCTKDGITPLMLASVHENKDMMEKIIEKGCDINAFNMCGQTALYVSSFKGFYNGVILLLSHGADTDIVNSQGSSPLMIACIEGHENVIKMLIDVGCSTDPVGSKSYLDYISSPELKDEISKYERVIVKPSFK